MYLFGSRFKTKSPTFKARKPDPTALAIDAFCLDFERLQILFLFFFQLGRKLSTENFSRQGNINFGCRFVDHTTMICDTTRNASNSAVEHEEKYVDTVRQLSGSSTRQETEFCSLSHFRAALQQQNFRQKQQTLSWEDGDPLHRSNISISHKWVLFEVEKRLMHSTPL